MRVRPPPSSTHGRQFSGQADLKSRANSAGRPKKKKRKCTGSVLDLSERIFAFPEQQV